MSVKLNRILCVDLEATCDEPKPNWLGEVIEVGLAILDLKKNEIEAHTRLVIPTSTPVTEFCTKLTSITPEMVLAHNGAVSFPEAMAWLRKMGSRNYAWASWGDYDRKQIQEQCSRENVQYPFGPTHLNVKALFGMVTGLTYGIGLKQAVELYKLDWVGTHHRGVDDAYNVAQVLQQIIKEASSES